MIQTAQQKNIECFQKTCSEPQISTAPTIWDSFPFGGDAKNPDVCWFLDRYFAPIVLLFDCFFPGAVNIHTPFTLKNIVYKTLQIFNSLSRPRFGTVFGNAFRAFLLSARSSTHRRRGGCSESPGLWGGAPAKAFLAPLDKNSILLGGQ